MACQPIQPGDELPDFDARTLRGDAVNYRRAVWQKKIVVLVTFSFPDSAAARAYRAALAARDCDLTAYETAVLVHDARVVGSVDAGRAIPVPSVVIADRWGEVREVQHPLDDRGLPPVDEIIEWLRFVQIECPECQGETR